MSRALERRLVKLESVLAPPPPPYVIPLIAWDDPDVGVTWPVGEPILSGRDEQGTSFKDYAQRPVFHYRR